MFNPVEDGVPTTVIHIRDKKPGDVYIGRAGKGEDGYFGNPHPVGQPCRLCDRTHQRGDAVEAYAKTFAQRIREDHQFRQRVWDLKGKTLVCFCAPHRCHGDVMAEWLNTELTDQKEKA